MSMVSPALPFRLVFPFYLSFPSESPSDLAPFKKFIQVVTDELKQQSHVVDATFPANTDVYYTFVDRVLEDVVGSTEVEDTVD